MGKLREEMGGELGNMTLEGGREGEDHSQCVEEPCSVCVVNPQVSGGGRCARGYCLGMVRGGNWRPPWARSASGRGGRRV